MKRAIKKWIVGGLAAISTLFAGLGVMVNSKTQAVYAETGSSFTMETGASVKLNSDGGIRFIANFDDETKQRIVDNDANNDVKLYFIIAPKSFFDKQTDGKYISLSKKVLVEVDEDKIYEEDGVWKANGCLTKILEKNRNLVFQSVAVIEDNSGLTTVYKYADNLENTARSTAYVLNEALTDPKEEYASSLIKSYEWLGSEGYPIDLQDDDDYQAFAAAVNRGVTFEGEIVHIAHTVDQSSVEITGECKATIKTALNAKVEHKFLYETNGQTLQDGTVISFNGDTSVSATVEDGEIQAVLENGEYSLWLDNFHETKTVTAQNGVVTGVDGDTLTLTRYSVSHNNSEGHYTATEDENGGHLSFTGNVSTSFWGKNTIGRGLDYSNAYLQFDYSTASNSVTSYRFLSFGSESSFSTVPTVVEGYPASSDNARFLFGAVTSAGACGTRFATADDANKVISWGMTENGNTFIRFAMFFETAGDGTKVSLYYISGGTTYNYLGYFVTSAPVAGLFNSQDSSDTDFAYSNVKAYDGASATAMRAATIGATYTFDVKHAYLYENEAYAFADGSELTFTGDETVVGTVENGKVRVALYDGEYTVSAAGHVSQTVTVTDGLISTTELNLVRNVVTEKSATGYVATNTTDGGSVSYTNYQPVTGDEVYLAQGVDFTNATMTFTFDVSSSRSSGNFMFELISNGARASIESAKGHNGTSIVDVSSPAGYVIVDAWGGTHARIYVANLSDSQNIGTVKYEPSGSDVHLMFTFAKTDGKTSMKIYYLNSSGEYTYYGIVNCAGALDGIRLSSVITETATAVSNVKIYDGGRTASESSVSVSAQHKFAYEEDAYALADGTEITLTAQDGTEITATLSDGAFSAVLEKTVYTVSAANHKTATLDYTDGVAESVVLERTVLEEKSATGYSATNGEYGGEIAYTNYKPAQEFAIGKGVDWTNAAVTFDLNFDSARTTNSMFLQFMNASGTRVTPTSVQVNGATPATATAGYVGFNGYTVNGGMYNRVYIAGTVSDNFMAVGSLKTSNPSVKIMLTVQDGTVTVYYKNTDGEYKTVGYMVVPEFAYLNIFSGATEANTVISNLQIYDGARKDVIFGKTAVEFSVFHKFAYEEVAYEMADETLTFTPISGIASQHEAVTATMSDGVVEAALYAGEYAITAENHKGNIVVKNGNIVRGLTDGVLGLQRLTVSEVSGTGYEATDGESGGTVVYTAHKANQEVFLGEGVDLTNAALTFDLDFDAARASSYLYLQLLNSSGASATVSSAEGNCDGVWKTISSPTRLITFNGYATTVFRVYTASTQDAQSVKVGSLATDHPCQKIALRFTYDGAEYTVKIYAMDTNGEYGLVGVINSPDIAKMNVFSSTTEANTVISNIQWWDGERVGQTTAFGFEATTVANYNLDGLHKVDVTESGKYLAKDGKNTGYNVVYGETLDADGTWAGVLAAYLYKSSDKTAIFSKVSETYYSEKAITWNSDRNWIVVGSTEIAKQAGITLPDGLGDTGYYIVSVGNSLFILANHTLGIRNGVYTFLDYTIGFDSFSADTVVYESKKDIPLYNFEIIEKPDFEYATAMNFINYAYVDEMRMQGLNEVFIPTNGKTFHNVFEFLDPDTYDKSSAGAYGSGSHSDWFSDTRSDREEGGSLWSKYPTNLCYTAHGDATEYASMVSTFTTALVDFLNQEGYESHPAIMISVNDEYDMCNCEACTSAKETYGANSGAMIQFMNDVSTALAAKTTREIELVVLAYYESASLYAPVINGVATITCNDNVSVMIAPIEGFFTKPLTDSANAEVAQVIDDWAKVSDELYLYLYNTNFHYMLYPYDSFEALPETYRFLTKYNVVCIYNQGQVKQTSPTAFNDLKQYVHSKLT